MQQRNKLFLAISSTIRRVLAGIFLVFFAFGISPKLILHNLVTNHKDGKTKTALPDPFSKQASKASFNCQCENNVIESPYTPQTGSFYLVPAPSFLAYQPFFSEWVYSSQPYCFSLRGPPAC